MLRDHLGPSMAKALATVVFQTPVISDPLIDFLKERLHERFDDVIRFEREEERSYAIG